MKNGFVNKNKFLEDFGRFFFLYFFVFIYYSSFIFVMEVSVDVVRTYVWMYHHENVRKRMVMIVFAKREVVSGNLYTCIRIIDTFNFIY